MVGNEGLYCVAGVLARFDCLTRETSQQIGLAGVQMSVELPGTEIVSACFNEKL